MQKEILYEIKAIYRDDFRITGYRFGKGKHAVCIMGNMRGNEYQQIYVCSQLIKKLRVLEERGRIKDGKEILVLISGLPVSARETVE